MARAAILQLCRITHLSLADLARLLNRNPKGLQNNYESNW